MKFDPNTFRMALWTNNDRRSEKAPTHRGTVTLGNLRVPIVGWYDESPEGKRPNISIGLERGYVMPSDNEDLQGENKVDHNKIETDRSARLDQMERDMEDKLRKLELILGDMDRVA